MTANPVTLQSGVELDLPYRGATFRVAVKRFWKKYAIFTGRASRSEFWWAFLFVAISGAAVDLIGALSLLTMNMGSVNLAHPVTPTPLFFIGSALAGLWGLIFIVPTYALTARRLHDTNRSGLFILMGFIPYVGPLIVLVLTLGTSNQLGERFDRPAMLTPSSAA